MLTKNRTFIWFMVLIILAGGFQLACALTKKATSTPVPVLSPTTAVAETNQPTAVPTTAPSSTPAPTYTPSPSPTPLPPLPPQIVDRSPSRGEESPVDAPLVIRFDQPMDKPSVETAFQIEPNVPGELSWADDRTLVFKPDDQYQRQSRYDVTIAQTAASVAGLEAELPYSFRFQTVGFLDISQVLPADGVQDVDVDSSITIMFNRPVVPLVHSAQISGLPDPLVLDPPVDGKGEWLNTSIYVFKPTAQLAAGTLYQATIKAGLEDQTGGVLAEDYTWSFSTQEPSITWFQPTDAETRIGLTANISVTFNQPMDKDSVEEAFQIFNDDGVAPRGRFEWSEDSSTMGWYPSGELDMSSHYTWELTQQARSAAGEAQLNESHTSEFWTVAYPELLYTVPGNAEKAADPYGGLELYFASPMDPQTILPNLTIIPEPTGVYTWWDSWDDRFYVGFEKLPSTDYVVTVGADMADPYGNTLGFDTDIKFTTAKSPPMAYLNTPGMIGTYNAYTPTVVYAVYRNVSQLDLTLARLDVDDLIGLTGPDSWTIWDSFWPDADQILRQWSVQVEDVLNKTSVWRIPLVDQSRNQLAPGIYYLYMTSPGFTQWDASKHLLVVSPINLTFKRSEDEVLVWATDLVSGQPVPDLPISIYNEKEKVVASGSTGKDGLFYESLDSYSDWLFAVSNEPGADDFSFSNINWTNGIGSWDFNLSYEDYAHQTTKIYLYTDRPIYRPGHTIYFKGILRDPDEARYQLPNMTTIDVEAYDWQDTLIYKETLPVSEMGTFAGQIQLASDAKTGNYHFIIDPDGVRSWQYFSIAEYRKPEFEVTVTPDKNELVAGDSLKALVESSYYFGGPVNDATVEWSIFADNYTFQGPGRYSYQDYQDWYWYAWDNSYTYGYGDLIANGSGVTDAKGHYIIDQPADLGDSTTPKLWTIEATVADVNQQWVTGRSQAIVHPASQYAGIYADRYVGKVGEKQTVNLIVVDLDGNPIPGAEATMVAYQREWFNVQIEDNGYSHWEWTVVDTPVYTETTKMDANGKAAISFTPDEGGSYRLKATTTDDAGRKNSASAFLWVSSSEYVSWRMDNNDRIELIADSDSYKPGDVAEILIPSPFQGDVKALITVERGRFFKQEILTLKSNSDIYRLPITADYAPTVYVSVVLIKGIDETNPISGFKMGMVKLNVSTEQQELTVKLTPDKETYGPGETATYDILVTDYENNPVEAELSLALVDLSVLALSPDQSPPILDAFYSERGVGVQTAIGLVLNVDRLNEEIADKAKGGGGGGDEAAMGIGLEVRTEFPDTAYWEAFLNTDANGHARVEIPLPDSLTTWRLSTKAITADTLVGQSNVDIVATKPLLVRPVTPRFFVAGDRARLGAVVHNNTDKTLDVEVTLAAEGVTLSDPAAQQVQVPSGGRIQVNWNIEVQDVENVGLIFSATGGGLSDASKPTLATGPDGTIPVYHYTSPDIVGTAGQLAEAGARTEGILLPPNVDTTQGSLQVEIAPSLAAAMQDGLDYLEHFPYECTEQTISRFLPNVLTFRAMKDLGITDPELEQKLNDLVNEGLQRLYNQQHYDGGWGWWSTSESSVQVTAWVLLGFDKAIEAGFPVDRQVLLNAQDFLSNRLSTPSKFKNQWEANRQAFVLYVLAERGETTVSRLETLYDQKDKLSHFGKAYLAMAYGLLEGDNSDRVQTLLADISADSILSATGAHWEEDYYDWWNWNTDTRSTAIILDLYSRFDPASDLAPNIVRWLMVARTAGHWETTQETAWALIALTDWMVATGELDANFDYDVSFNNQLMAQGTASRETIRQTTDLQIAIRDMLLDQVNQLSIGRSEGPGRLYYTAHLETYLPVQDVEPIGRGVMVAREYTAASCDPDKETCEQLDSIPLGEAVRVKLTIVAPNDLYYVVVEDPLPAGAEAVDQTLLTSSSIDADQGWSPSNQEYRWGYWGWWWFNQTQMLDEKVVLFADYLPEGTYEYTYTMRASLPGEFQVLPTTAREFYFPEVFGRSDGMLFTIQP